MDFTLVNTDFLPTGIFGKLISEDNSLILETLQHAYLSNATYVPKLPLGVYNCVRGEHKLEGMKNPFETFEITQVPGHTGILFHTGNMNSDSAGCVLLGSLRDGHIGILGSQIALERFLNFQWGVQEFVLTVK